MNRGSKRISDDLGQNPRNNMSDDCNHGIESLY